MELILSFIGICFVLSFFVVILGSVLVKIDDFKYYYPVYKSLKYKSFIKSGELDPVWIEENDHDNSGVQILSDGSFKLNADHWLCKNWTLYFSPFSWYWWYKYDYYFKRRIIRGKMTLNK